MAGEEGQRRRVGVRTLKELALHGCFRISHVITDVGDLPYGLVEPILKRMPVEQLRTIEVNCPQIAQRAEPLWRNLVAKKFGDRPVPQPGTSRKMYAKYEKEEQKRLLEVAERLRQNNLRIQMEKEQKKTIQLENDPRTEQMRAQRRLGKTARPGSRNLQQAYNSARAKGSIFSNKNIQFASMSSMMGTLPTASKTSQTESETKARQRALASAHRPSSPVKPVTSTAHKQQQTASPIKKAAVRSSAPSIFLRPKR